MKTTQEILDKIASNIAIFDKALSDEDLPEQIRAIYRFQKLSLKELKDWIIGLRKEA